MIQSRWGSSWGVSLSGGSRGRELKPTGWWVEVLKTVEDRNNGWVFQNLGRELGEGSDILFGKSVGLGVFL